MTKKICNYSGRNYSKIRENDRISKETRSKVMSKIRSSGTKLELTFLKALEDAIHLPFEKNVRSIRGKPDIVFFEKKICIFIDSDFWHGWQYPRWKMLLKDDNWREKIEKNRRRDRLVTQYLKRHGWIVIRVWEHNIKLDLNGEIQQIRGLLNNIESRNNQSG